MTLTIGRATLGDPMPPSQSGDALSLTVPIDSSWLTGSVGQAKAVRQQIVGMHGNPDELVVPVVWTDDHDLDGFYRVTSTSVESLTTYLLNGTMTAQVQLERVSGGFGYAPQEVQISYADRTDFQVSSNRYLWVPAAATWQGVGTVAYTRSTATGSVSGFDLDSASTVLPGTYTVAASDFYDGACLIEQQISGTWYPMVGRQSPAASALRLSNGVIRITPGTGPMLLEVWDGSAWDSVGSFHMAPLLSGSPYGSGSYGACSVAVNTVTTGAIVFDVGTASRITVGMNRGDLFATLRFGGPILERASVTTVDVAVATSTAATSFGGGSTANIRQTSNGATGHRWIISGPNGSTMNTANGIVSIDKTEIALLGVELNGSSAVAPNTASEVAYQSHIAMAQRQLTVTR